MNRKLPFLAVLLLGVGAFSSAACAGDSDAGAEGGSGGSANGGSGGAGGADGGSGGNEQGGSGGQEDPSRCEAMCARIYDVCETSIDSGDMAACILDCEADAFSTEEITCFETSACDGLDGCAPAPTEIPETCEAFCDAADSCSWLGDEEDEREFCLFQCERVWHAEFQCIAAATSACDTKGFDSCFIDPAEPAECTELCDQIYYECDVANFEKGSRAECGRKCMDATETQRACVQEAALSCDQRSIDSCMIAATEAPRCTDMCDHLYYDCEMSFSGRSRAGCGTACTNDTMFFDDQTVACFTTMECNFDAALVCFEGG